MLENEKKIIGYLEEKKDILFFLIISLLGIYIRYQGRDAMSGDMVNCLIPWYDRIKQGGKIAMLRQQVGNYNILYQTIIVLFTYINDESVKWVRSHQYAP